jgi:hypothetical protein
MWQKIVRYVQLKFSMHIVYRLYTRNSAFDITNNGYWEKSVHVILLFERQIRGCEQFKQTIGPPETCF